MSELDKYRKQIDEINSEIIRLLGKRMDLVKMIGKFKKQNGVKILDEKREKEIFKRLREEAKKEKLNEDFINKLFKLVIKNSRKVQG